MKKIIWKIVKHIFLFITLYFAFFMIPSTITGFRVGFQTHNSELAGKQAAEVGQMLGKEYGLLAFWVILSFCVLLFVYNIYRDKNKEEKK